MGAAGLVAFCAHCGTFFDSSSHTLALRTPGHRARLPGPTEMTTVWQVICQAVLTTEGWDDKCGGQLGTSLWRGHNTGLGNWFWEVAGVILNPSSALLAS